MIADDVLSRLDHVRRSGRGWMARCPVPSHDDRNPSLSIHEGDRAVLLKCWAGCPLDEICAAILIHPRDLFYNEKADPKRLREVQTRRERKVTSEAAIHEAKMILAGIYHEAEAIVREATDVDISGWSMERLDQVMNDVAFAGAILLIEEDYAEQK